LQIRDIALYQFSGPGFNNGQTFGLTLAHPKPLSGGELHLSAQNWRIGDIGNDLVSYTDPDSGITYPASKCRITVTGHWSVTRKQNSNSFNSVGILYSGQTETDQATREMTDNDLLNLNPPDVTYVIQGSGVDGGAINTFGTHVFYCKVTEQATSDNSNKQFTSNTVTTPVWVYEWTRSWQVD
jgi:hypothetical protein